MTNAVVAIEDDDAAPTISVSDFSITEGNTGADQTANFNVTLSDASESNITVAYTVTAGTADVIDDYSISSVNGTLSFAAGDTSESVGVTIVGDDIFEADETVFIEIGGVTDDLASTDLATISDANGIGTIVDNEDPPNISVAVSSGNPFTETAGGVAVFEVSIDRLSSVTTTVQYDTGTTGTATSGTDFVALTAQTLTWGPNTNDTKLISVTISTDNIYENPDENFPILLSMPGGGAVILVSSASATIDDDDPVPVVTLVSTSATVSESVGTADIVLAISNPSGAGVTVNYTTTNGTATSVSDYTAVSGGSVTFGPDSGTDETASISITADLVDELNEDEEFTVQFAGPNFSGPDTFTVMIQDDDDEPIITIADVSVADGDAGAVTHAISVTMTGLSDQVVTVDYVSSSAAAVYSATAGTDYEAIPLSTLTWAAGIDGPMTIPITITGDTVYENNERLKSFSVIIFTAQ